jgi:hypothetical protein
MILGNLARAAADSARCRRAIPPAGDALDPAEPANVARMAADMKLRYVVITSVNRDDLRDGGSAHFAETVRQVRRALPEARVEVLTPDFCGDLQAVARVLDAGPHVFNHNMETVPRLYAACARRPITGSRSTCWLSRAAIRPAPDQVRLHGGLGRNRRRSARLLRDLRAAGTDVATIGQYLQPTRRNLPVAEYVEPRNSTAIAITASPSASNGLQRPAGAQFLHGRPGQRRARCGAVLKLKYLGALSPPSCSSCLSALQSGVVRARGAGALLVAVAREPAVAPLSAGLESPAWSIGSASATGSRACWPTTAASTVPLAWLAFLLFCLIKALHMGVFALLAGILMRRWWAAPAVAALWVAIEATHGSLGFAWLALGNAGIDMGLPMRLAPLTSVYGLSFVFMVMATAWRWPCSDARACT